MTNLVKFTIPSLTHNNATLIGKAIADARVILQDNEEPYRVNDDEMLVYLNEFYQTVPRIRPDLVHELIASDTAYPPVYKALKELKDVNFLLSPEYFPALTYFIAGRASARDDQFQIEGRAAAFVNLSKSILLGLA